MKISELTTDRAADVLCEASIYISNICSDKELMAEISKDLNLKGDESTLEHIMILANKVSALSPLVFKHHKNDIFGIVAVFNGVTAADVGKQNIMITMAQIKDLFDDKEFKDFFTSFMPLREKSREPLSVSDEG